MPVSWFMLLLGLWAPLPSSAYTDDVETVRPLWHRSYKDPQSLLPRGTTFLDDPVMLERFLAALDGTPPDWKGVYRGGEEGHGDRLFLVNRNRDRLREGNPALQQRVAFVWEGIVSGYDPTTGGFRLAIGPKVIPTKWGQVRFKPYGLPSGLVAVPSPSLRKRLRDRKARGESIDVDLILTGRLTPEESIIYDFAHEEPGQGMVMPVVQVERVDYFLAD